MKPEAYNVLLPGDLKVVGPETDAARQERYLEAAFARASSLGGQVAVFGSGGARRIPPGWPREEAQRQVREFLGRAGTAAARHGMTIAIEPLNVTECNFINSVAEAVALAREVNHPAVAVLSDLYHVDHDGQSYEETRERRPAAAPCPCRRGEAAARRTPADHAFLRDYFAVLKASGYAGRVSIEGSWEDLPAQAAEALARAAAGVGRRLMSSRSSPTRRGSGPARSGPAPRTRTGRERPPRAAGAGGR